MIKTKSNLKATLFKCDLTQIRHNSKSNRITKWRKWQTNESKTRRINEKFETWNRIAEWVGYRSGGGATEIPLYLCAPVCAFTFTFLRYEFCCRDLPHIFSLSLHLFQSVPLSFWHSHSLVIHTEVIMLGFTDWHQCIMFAYTEAHRSDDEFSIMLLFMHMLSFGRFSYLTHLEKILFSAFDTSPPHCSTQ